MSTGNYHSALGQYRTVNAYASVSASDHLRLVDLLMQGAIDGLAMARGHMARGNVSAKGEQIGRVIMLIDGLRASLDKERGSEIATNLERLYEYMMRRLLQANMNDSEEILDEISDLLREIRAGWEGVIAQSREIVGADGNAAAGQVAPARE